MKRISILIIILALASFMLLPISSAAQYSQEVYQAQKALKELGYNPGKVDGVWGKATRRSIERYQREMGLPVTGRLDDETKERLGIGIPERAIRVAQRVKEQRLALVIGNGAYKSSPLKNPVNDAYDMARTLKILGFEVIHKENAGQKTMKEAIREFGKRLRRDGCIGLFYFAGHGIQVKGINYLIPVDAKIETESDVEYEAVDAGRILGKMEDAGNDLNIVIVDACRDNPFALSFRSGSRGLARMDAPKGNIIVYATAPGKVAADGEGRNGIYTKHLLKHMKISGLTVEQVLKKVRVDVIRETGSKQVPWESSSLTGDFYFAPKRAIVIKKERELLERERKELERLKIDRKRLEAGRKRLEAEKQKLEIAKLTPTLRLKEIARDGRLIAYDNGTVKDTRTGLMWASKDNGRDVTWKEAKEYCENYRGGGYTDWRMPTQDELAGLYDKNKSYQVKRYNIHLTELIQLSSFCPWASETRGSVAAYFGFSSGSRYWGYQFNSYNARAVPVRSGNKEKLEIAKLPPKPKNSPSVIKSKEIARDGRFITYDNRTIMDTRTGLMWAAKDNGYDIDWKSAKFYCENYRVGGYADWRMPTQDELASICDRNLTRPRKNEYIDVTANWVWASEASGSEAKIFDFHYDRRIQTQQSYNYNRRALPVRDGN
jgi:hypothetical protein